MNWKYYMILMQYGCFESFPFRQKKIIFVRQITWFRWISWYWTSGVNVHNKNVRSSTSKNLNIFCKRQISNKLFYLYQRLQCRDKYFFKIKFVFFICGCQHHQRKTICLYVYISDIRQTVGCRTPVFIQWFPWRLHITITYNLPHLRLWYADVVTVIA